MSFVQSRLMHVSMDRSLINFNGSFSLAEDTLINLAPQVYTALYPDEKAGPSPKASQDKENEREPREEEEGSEYRERLRNKRQLFTMHICLCLVTV